MWEVATADPDRRRPLREAAADGQRFARERHHRVLVVANRTLDERVVAGGAREPRGGGARSCTWSRRSSARACTTSRRTPTARCATRASGSRELLDWAQANGVAATGTVGDPNVALGAIEDELRRFGADEVLISTHPPSQSNWLETGILVRLRDELEIPVTHMVVGARTGRVGAGHRRP